MSPLVAVSSLAVGYAPQRPVAEGFTFEVGEGESVAIVGPSGSGKSTLLYTVAGLIAPLAGTVHLLGVDVGAASDHDRARFRSAHLGFVFQDAILDQARTVLDNVTEVVTYLAVPRRAFAERANELLEQLGIAGLGGTRPGQMSGGQVQRVGVARALLAQPRILIADEPTGNLDRDTADQVLTALLRFVEERPACLLVATHDPQISARCGQVIHL